jgi:hypothetical protein
MRLSREKINLLSHLIVQELANCKEVKLLQSDNDVRLEVLRVITEELMVDDEIDQRVRQKLASYSRPILEGSREWDIMYRKLYEEELNRLGRK